MTTSLSERGAVVGAQRAPVGDGGVPLPRPSGACARPFRYSNVVSSGATRPALAPASMLMLHTVMRPSIESARMAEPRYSMTWPMPPPVPMRADDGEHDVLGGDVGGSVALDGDGHPLRPRLRQRLGGEHVLDLAGADAEGQRAERAVGGGVAVAAHDGHAGQRAALLGGDDVDDALAGVAHREVGDAELGGVLAQHLDLAGRDRVGDRLVDVGRGDVVVLGGDREVGAADRAAGEAQAVERLRAGDLVDEVEVDVQQVGLVGCRRAPRGGPRPSGRSVVAVDMASHFLR